MSLSLVSKYLNEPARKKNSLLSLRCSGDVLAASVINQKVVTQSVQQVLVILALQVLNLIEAQFGFATNLEQDDVNV
jgi:hypothetical protein